MASAIEGFRRHWEFAQSMTLDFANEVPDPCREFSPHGRFAPFSEAIHQGQRSLHAPMAGFETPLSWRLNWGL